jgi:hypothetical protein
MGTMMSRRSSAAWLVMRNASGRKENRKTKHASGNDGILMVQVLASWSINVFDV